MVFGLQKPDSAYDDWVLFWISRAWDKSTWSIQIPRCLHWRSTSRLHHIDVTWTIGWMEDALDAGLGMSYGIDEVQC